VKILENKLKSMYIEGAEAMAESIPSEDKTYSSVGHEAEHLLKFLKYTAADGPAWRNEEFNKALLRVAEIWGKVYNRIAKQKIAEYSNVDQIPANIFRSAAGTGISKTIQIAGTSVKIVPSKLKELPEVDGQYEIVYTADELETLEKKGLLTNEFAMSKFNQVKRVFGPAWIRTEMDVILESKKVVHEGNTVYNKGQTVNRQRVPRELRIPLEEQQRYTTRTS